MKKIKHAYWDFSVTVDTIDVQRWLKKFWSIDVSLHQIGKAIEHMEANGLDQELKALIRTRLTETIVERKRKKVG